MSDGPGVSQKSLKEGSLDGIENCLCVVLLPAIQMDHWQNLIDVKFNPEHFLQFRAAQVGSYIWHLVPETKPSYLQL